MHVRGAPYSTGFASGHHEQIFSSYPFLWCEILCYVSGTPTFAFDQRQRRSCPTLGTVSLASSVQAS